ncbi:hypothetical protein M9Y10_012426 [Tritrichomonas musculus]|uniref:Protein kinase domain-containing protein n=1 Tax=Tritrichomonas musculus TaxID=1915356 RepID=A0ABR2IEU1_9EUKA
MLPSNKEILDLSDYERDEKLFKNEMFKYYKIIHQSNNKKFLAKIWTDDLDHFIRDKIRDLYREVYINSKINHPSFLKYVGFSLVNFKNKRKPLIVFEYASTGSLNMLLNSTKSQYERKDYHQIYQLTISSDDDDNDDELEEKENIVLTMTQKLIIIYGIAAGISYLHSHDILHRNLNPSSIFLDDSLFPKISGLDISKELIQSSPYDEPRKDGKLKGEKKYLAPEVLSKLEYGKPNDVYAFSLVVYEIMTGKSIYQDFDKTIDLIENVSKQGKRPTFECEIPSCYQNLIERCWSQDPKDRPTFDEIVDELKNNREFITDEVDENQFQNYVNFIETASVSFDPEKTIEQMDELLQSNTNDNKSSDIKPGLRGQVDSSVELDVQNYIIKNEEDGIVVDKETNIKFDYFLSKPINKYLRYEIINYARKVNILSRLDHPAILKFVGYSPVDFKNFPKPTYITEHYKSRDLAYYNEGSFDDQYYLHFDDTQKLIFIYGIASGMAYLHSHNILHRNLKTETIVFNKYFFPKILGFEIAKEIESDSIEPNDTIKGTPACIAPEVYLKKGYSKSSDVYSFSLILYELMTGEKAFKELKDPREIKKTITELNERPEFKQPILQCYRELIEKCWSQEPSDRPTFDEILTELKTNPEFITDTVDKDAFFEYVAYVDEFPVNFYPNRRVEQLDDILKNRLNSFPDIHPSIHFSDMRETEKNDLIIDDKYYLNPDDYDYVSYITKGNFYDVKKVEDKKSQILYAQKKTNNNSLYFHNHEIINFSRELNILLQINHPSILRFIGYYLGDGIEDGKVYIIVEFSSKGSLGKIHKSKRTSKYRERYNSHSTNDEVLVLNSTQKLIIIYGIAAGMSYLHSHNILHRDLKLNNIYLDDSMFPKISGFNIAKEIESDSIEPNDTIKGTPACIAPEVYLKKGYSKSSDVYSFSLIIYELMTGEKAFKELKDPKEIKRTIIELNERPAFNKPILQCYRDLIEKCWSQEPSDRPTFDEILTELKTNPDFITDDINNDEYQSYIKFIDESPASFEYSHKILQLDEYVKNKLNMFYEITLKINFYDIYETETNNICTEYNFCDITNFQKQKLMQKERHFKFYIVSDIKTKSYYFAKKILDFRESSNSYYKDKTIELTNEINNMLKVNHPMFLKFIGYSPFDLKSELFPLIIFEHASNGSLERMMEIGAKNKRDAMFNDTKKLIILYGIATAMSYLHSIDIIHCKLRPSNIFLDDFLFPKITGFDISKNLSDFPIRPLSEIVDSGTVYYDSDIHNPPELMTSFIYSAAGDVYSFGVIAYEFVTEETPFLDELSYNGYRPDFKETTPDCYKKLISKCWAHDPVERPTFEEILKHMKTNPEFITENVDKEEFQNFVQFIDEIQNKFQKNDEAFELDNFIKTQNQRFRKVKIDYNKLRDWKRQQLTVNLGSSDLTKYSKLKKIGNGSFGNVYKIIDKQSNVMYAAKVSKYEIDQCSNDIILNLSREIDIISGLNFPSILKFIGFCPNDFKGKPKPVIITEYALNCSLDYILDMERKGIGNHDWDDTKKLINIYGIAHGMAYLACRDIIHRDLKPANILLDEYLYPKIADFGMAKSIKDKSSFDVEEKHKKPVASGFKGTYAYSAPEIIKKHEYSNKGDVYAFAMITYEIITNEIPFSGFNQYQLFGAIIKGYRPKFRHPIPYCYKNLIRKCWSENPNSRPYFRDICKLLENDPNFITPNVNKEEYYDYIAYLNAIYGDVENEKKNQEEINHTNSLKNKVNKVDVSLIRVEETEDEDVKCDCFIDLSRYERQDILNKCSTYKICQIRERETQNQFAAFMSMYKIKQISKEEAENLSNELKVISQLNHPSLLKFVGFSLTDFKKERKPVIVTELVSNGSLEQILELEKNDIKINGWDSTKKLINIYGIASGMACMHSHGVIHRCLKPSNIYLDEILLPKIGDFGLMTQFCMSDSMTHQSISGETGSPVYTAPEVLEANACSKSMDVYSFSYVVYEILTKEKPFSETDKASQIYQKVVMKGERPVIKENIPRRFKTLIEECWSQDPNQRPTFDDIVYQLRMDDQFITEEISKDDYSKYIEFIDSQISRETEEKIDEDMPEKILETEPEADTINKNEANFVLENQDEVNLEFKELPEKTICIDDVPIIDKYIMANDARRLMDYLIRNCDNETVSFVFDKCHHESKEFYAALCKEGLLSNNAVSHHKCAISLIFDSQDDETVKDRKLRCNEARKHLEAAIELGFNLSFFSLSRLHYEFYKDDEKAFEIAKEGSERGEKYSRCLLGFFTAHGIGTKKDIAKGVPLILSSSADDFIDQFATEIGIYYSMKNDEEEGQKEVFKWFQKAFTMRKTRATINNYGVCYMIGIGVDKSIEKAKEIFQIGVDKNDANSMYHIGFILEGTEKEESLKYYKKAAELGDPRSQLAFAKLIEEKDPNLSLQFYKRAAERNVVEALEILAMKYASENDTENAVKYVSALIKEGGFQFPLKYGIDLYRKKQMKQSFLIFEALSEFNHPIAKYFIAVMKFRGEGCIQNKVESLEIMKSLSNQGVDKATEFLEKLSFMK